MGENSILTIHLTNVLQVNASRICLNDAVLQSAFWSVCEKER